MGRLGTTITIVRKKLVNVEAMIFSAYERIILPQEPQPNQQTANGPQGMNIQQPQGEGDVPKIIRCIITSSRTTTVP